jgi:hypothetical protein
LTRPSRRWPCRSTRHRPTYTPASWSPSRDRRPAARRGRRITNPVWWPGQRGALTADLVVITTSAMLHAQRPMNSTGGVVSKCRDAGSPGVGIPERRQRRQTLNSSTSTGRTPGSHTCRCPRP